MRTGGIVAGVVSEFEKIVDVGMPGFEIDTAGTFTFAALVYRSNARVECPFVPRISEP